MSAKLAPSNSGNMEPTKQQRLLHRPQDADERPVAEATNIHENDVYPPKESRLSDSNLVQWKLERLAHHHAHYARLIKAFGRWKQVTELRRQRRQLVIAACRVGAKFFQRLFWNQWKEYAKRRLQARRKATERLQRVQDQVRLQWCFLQLRLFAGERQQAQATEKPKVSTAERLTSDRRLEVRGVRIQRDKELRLPRPEPLAPSAVDVADDLQHERQEKLREIVVYHTQRQYFQLWRHAATTLQRIVAKTLRDQKADQFRIHSAWRRWRRGSLARFHYDSTSRRAAFFLYYQLTKSSLRRMKTHADRQRRERGVSVTIEARVRRRTLAAVLGMWQQRLNTKLVFTNRRDAFMDEQYHKPHPQHLEAIGDFVSGSSSARLLRQYFSVWLQRYAQRQRIRVLAKIVEGPLSHGRMRSGFEIWWRQTTQQRHVQELVAKRNRAQVTSVWRAWAQVTTEKQKREQRRRKAARFWYYRTLRKVFSVLQGLQVHREKLELLVERTVESRKQVQTLTIFQRWRDWSRSRCRHRLLQVQAMEHHKFVTARLSFGAWRENVRQAKSLEEAAKEHAEKAGRQKVRLIFQAWKAFYQHEQARNKNLSEVVASYRDARAMRLTRGGFEALDEHARSRVTRRVVNAHARGHYQATLLRHSFAVWNSSVAQLKWEHIFNHRAQQFRDQRRKSKCFQLWRVHAQALQREREQTKVALHHWKKVRERKAFDAWKQYIDGKRRQRERMHAALEFRDRAHIRDGLSHWITSATHVAEQRSRRAVESQAVHTARIWGRVREIAMHWRWLVQQKKLREKCPKSRTNGFEQDRDEGHVIRRADDFSPQSYPIQSRVIRPAATLRDESMRARDHQPALSEFVMLPRNRPRPRKPIELILDGGESIEGDHVDSEIIADTLHDLNTRYGFQFPTKLVATPLIEARQTMREPSVDTSSAGFEESKGEIVSYEGWTIDELEKRLLYWHDRRQRLKTLQQSLEDFRLLLQEALTEGYLPARDFEHMKARLHAMEQQEATCRHQWEESRPEIRMLAKRIKLLRATTTAVPA